MTCQCCPPTVENERDSHAERRPEQAAEATTGCGPDCGCGGGSDPAADHTPPSATDRPALASTRQSSGLGTQQLD